jgi:hypothetical protein
MQHIPNSAGTLTQELFEANGVPVSEKSVASPATPNARSKAFFEEAITGCWGKSAQGFVDTGSYLLQAREELGRDVYNALRLPFSPRTRQRLIAIASHPILATHVSHLPPCWGTLYALTELEDDVLRAALVDGRIHPGLQRNKIRTEVLRLPPKEREVAKPASPMPDLTPTQLQAQIEKLGPRRFREEVLPADWIPSLTNTAVSLATLEKLIAALEHRIPVANKTARKRLRELKAAVDRPRVSTCGPTARS